MKEKEKQVELSEAHAELMHQRSKKEELVDAYMESEEFTTLMEKLVETLYPAQFTIG